jgi:hypothetical protein
MTRRFTAPDGSDNYGSTIEADGGMLPGVRYDIGLKPNSDLS